MAREFTLHGFDKLENLLRQLPETVAEKVAVGGLRAGARVLVKGMKQRVPVRTGELRDSVTQTSAKKVTQGRGRVSVGFKKPASRRAHLIEFGTEHSAAEPFIRPTLDEDGVRAIEEIRKLMGRGIEREARKLAGR